MTVQQSFKQALRTASQPRPVKLTVRDFLLLDEAGAFQDNARTELLDGRIYVMNSQHMPHARAKTNIAFALRDKLIELGSPLTILIEASVRVEPFSVPEPDVAVIVDNGGRDIVPNEDCRLFVEVAGSSLKLDAGKKARIYAKAGVPEYWIVDLNGREVRRLTRPTARGYTLDDRIPFGARVESLTIPGLAVDTADLA